MNHALFIMFICANASTSRSMGCLGENRISQKGYCTCVFADEKSLVSVCQDGVIRKWRLSDGENTRTVKLGTKCRPEIERSGNSLVIHLSERNEILFFDIKSFKLEKKFEIPFRYTAGRIFPGGDKVLLALQDCSVCVLEFGTRTVSTKFEPKLKSPNATIYNMAISQDSKYFALAFSGVHSISDNRLVVIDTLTMKSVWYPADIENHRSFASLAFQPEANTLIYSGGLATIAAFDITKLKYRYNGVECKHIPTRLVGLTNGRCIATLSSGEIGLYSNRLVRTLCTVEVSTSAYYDIEISPNKTQLCVWAYDPLIDRTSFFWRNIDN